MDLRLARTILTSDVTTTLTYGRLALEEGLTLVACSANTLFDFFVDHVLAACSRLQGKRRTLHLPSVVCDSSMISIRLLASLCKSTGFLFFLCADRRVTRASFATNMLAVGAHLVHAKGCLTAMACATHPHSNWLFHPLHLIVVR